jgi:tellurite methyltransferase
VSGVLPGSAVSPFVAEWLPRVAEALGAGGRARRALDLAMGEGRHALPLARAGFVTFGVDRSLDRVRLARRRACAAGVSVHAWAADLDTYPMPAERFDLLFCTRFLLRARWDDLQGSVTPGGFVLYETFTTRQVKLGRGPSSPDHLLEPGELAAAFGHWDILFSEEVDAPAAMARLIARKPGAAPAPRNATERRS